MGCCQAAREIMTEAMPIPPDTLSLYNEGQFKTTDGTAELPIRLGPKGPSAKEPATVLSLFEKIIFEKKKGGLPALRQEVPVPKFSGDPTNDTPSLPLNQWKTWTFQQYYDESKTVARAYLSLGLDRHASVNIWGFNSPEWFLAEMGAIFAGGKAAGIYPTDTRDQILYKIQHSNGQIVVIEDQRKFLTLANVAGQLPNVKAIVCWAFEPSAEQRDMVPCHVLTWTELMQRGDGNVGDIGDVDKSSESKNDGDAAAAGGGIADLEEALKARMADQKPGHCCALIYTSGTTGQPKAVMISHDNIVFESSVVWDIMPIGRTEEQERILSYLPLSHVAGMLLDIIAPLYSTANSPSHTTVHFARVYDLSKGTLGNRLRAVRPTLFLGVPRVWEKIQAKITKIGASTTGLRRKIAMWAKNKGEQHAIACQLGGSGEYPGCYGLASKLVHAKVKAALGLEECKFAFTGAAPISVDTLQFFARLGLQINEVYGMSECTGATTWSTDNCHIWGSCGFAMPGMEVAVFKLNEDGSCGNECPAAPSVAEKGEQYQGEICFRGRHIMMGYMANPDMGDEHINTITRKLDSAIDNDGWLHSGDKGIKTVSGMFKITGRYKELLIGAGGENVAPVPIEDAVKTACPAISNIMMFGDRRPFLAAMVTLKAAGNPGESKGTDELDCTIPGTDVSTISEAMSDKVVIQYITNCIIEGNKAAPNSNSTIKKFTILPHDFSVEGGELTSTLKLKRSVAVQHFAEVAERTYDPALGRAPYVPFNPKGAVHSGVVVDSAVVVPYAEEVAAEKKPLDDPAAKPLDPPPVVQSEPVADTTPLLTPAVAPATEPASAEPDSVGMHHSPTKDDEHLEKLMKYS